MKEVAFSGVFPLVTALGEAGVTEIFVHDPMFSDADLAALGFTPYHFGDPVDIAIVQTDHDEYSSIGAQDLPNVRLVLDGRNVLDASLFGSTTFLRMGRGVKPLAQPERR